MSIVVCATRQHCALARVDFFISRIVILMPNLSVTGPASVECTDHHHRESCLAVWALVTYVLI